MKFCCTQYHVHRVVGNCKQKSLTEIRENLWSEKYANPSGHITAHSKCNFKKIFKPLWAARSSANELWSHVGTLVMWSHGHFGYLGYYSAHPRGVSILATLILCAVDIIPRVGWTCISIALILVGPTFLLSLTWKQHFVPMFEVGDDKGGGMG